MKNNNRQKPIVIWSLAKFGELSFWFASYKFQRNMYYYPESTEMEEVEEKGRTYYSRKEFFGPDGVLSKVAYYGHGATNLYPLTIYSDVEPSVEMISALKEKGFDVYILRSDHC